MAVGPLSRRSILPSKGRVEPTTLILYDPAKDLKVSADASSFSLGAVLLQNDNSVWRPVVYASRSMSNTECRYMTGHHIQGKSVTMETDHKPLVPLLSMKHLDGLPTRVLQFRLRLDRFDDKIIHVPGKQLYTADTLSRSPLNAEVNSNDL